MGTKAVQPIALFFVGLMCSAPVSGNSLSVVTKVFEHVLQGIDIAKTIVGFFEFDDNNDMSNEIRQSFAEMKDVIRQSAVYVKNEIITQLQLRRLEEVQTSILSVLTDMERWANDKNDTVRRDRFLDQSGNVIDDIRYLPVAFTETIAGIDNSLLTKIAQNSRCDVGKLLTFIDYYFNLTRTGMIIELVKSEVEGVRNLDQERDYWNDMLELMKATVFEVVDDCKEQFDTLIKEYLQLTSEMNATYIQEAIITRYPWLWNDVFVFPKGRNEIQAVVYGEKSLYHIGSPPTSDDDILVVHADLNSNLYNITDDEDLMCILNNFVPVGAVNNAKDIATAVKSHICGRGYTMDFISVIWDDGVDIKQHKDSPAFLRREGKYYISLLVSRSGSCVQQEAVSFGVVNSANNKRPADIWQLVLFALLYAMLWKRLDLHI